MKRQELLSKHISLGRYPDFVNRVIGLAKTKKSTYVCVANVHMFVEAEQDDKFAQILNKADMVTPDGLPLTWALKRLHGIDQDRVSGMDLLPDLLDEAGKENVPVYIYGGTQTMLDSSWDYIKDNYPSTNVAGTYSPPFRALTEEEDQKVITEINESGAQLVFVALGCPKQEKWISSMKGKINACMIGIGGALPVLIGMQDRAPLWMQNAGLEWLFRLAQEPKRLFRRYAVTNSIFCWLFLKAWARQGFRSKRSENSKHPIQLSV